MSSATFIVNSKNFKDTVRWAQPNPHSSASASLANKWKNNRDNWWIISSHVTAYATYVVFTKSKLKLDLEISFLFFLFFKSAIPKTALPSLEVSLPVLSPEPCSLLSSQASSKSKVTLTYHVPFPPHLVSKLPLLPTQWCKQQSSFPKRTVCYFGYFVRICANAARPPLPLTLLPSPRSTTRSPSARAELDRKERLKKGKESEIETETEDKARLRWRLSKNNF